MSGVAVDATEYVPVDRWRRLGRIDAIRTRVKRIAIGAGIALVGLTLWPAGDLSPVVGLIRLLALVTGVSAWSVSEALKTATDDDADDGSVLAAVGVIVLAALAWGAGRSNAGSLLWRLLLGEAVTAATEPDAGGTDVGSAGSVVADTDPTVDGRADPTAGANIDPTATAAADRDVGAASQPTSTYVGLLAALLAGGVVLLASLPRAGGFDPGAVGVFLLLTAVVGGVVGLFAGLSIR
ncbi:hypothetical protein [Haloplanus sp.]|uniref:hypothetical protein n=1 Tax=Haloplanus sp. TaxID=1961696 RepID=UPI002611CFF5|nr:hypothetical protein [Haloplanus sp.]